MAAMAAAIILVACAPTRNSASMAVSTGSAQVTSVWSTITARGAIDGRHGC